MTSHNIGTTGDRERGFRARCLTHDCWTLDNYPSADAAYAAFECDEGSDVRFVVQLDDAPPTWADLSGIRDRMRSFAQDRAYGDGCYEDMRAWRWAGDGQLEPLTVGCAKPGEFNDEDWAFPVWAATGPDGVEYARVTVRIDGRA